MAKCFSRRIWLSICSIKWVSASANAEIIEAEMQILRARILELRVSPEQIYNCDETAFFTGTSPVDELSQAQEILELAVPLTRLRSPPY